MGEVKSGLGSNSQAQQGPRDGTGWPKILMDGKIPTGAGDQTLMFGMHRLRETETASCQVPMNTC